MEYKYMSAKRQEEEMTMDEILASIRKYVIDDHGAEKVNAPYNEQNQEAAFRNAPQQHFAPATGTPHQDVQNFQSTQPLSPAPINVLDLTKPYQPEVQNHKTKVAPEETQTGRAVNEQKPDTILSEKTLQASIGSLSKLVEMQAQAKQAAAVNSTQQKNTTMENFLSDLVRPMIKQWLDANLPTLVDTIVTREVNQLMRKIGS